MKDILKQIGKRLDELSALDQEDTEEYSTLSEQYQSLSLDLVEQSLFEDYEPTPEEIEKNTRILKRQLEKRK